MAIKVKIGTDLLSVMYINLFLSWIDKESEINKYSIYINYLEPIRSRENGSLALEFQGVIAATRTVITMNYQQISSLIFPNFRKPLTERNYIEMIKAIDNKDREFVFSLIPNMRIYFNSHEALNLVEIIDKLCELLNQNPEEMLEEAVKSAIQESSLPKPEVGSSTWNQLKKNGFLQFFDD